MNTSDTPSTITLSHETDVDAPAVVAWAVLADYARDPEWRAGVAGMAPSPPGPAAVGTTTTEQLRFAGRTWRSGGEVTAVEPGRRFAWRTTSGAVAHGARTVEALGTSRCRVRLDLTVTPTGLQRLATPLFRRMLARNLAGDLQRLRALIECAPAVTAAPA